MCSSQNPPFTPGQMRCLKFSSPIFADQSLVKKHTAQAGLQPTIVSYGSMLSAFEEVGKWQLALALFQLLPTVTLQPSVT